MEKRISTRLEIGSMINMTKKIYYFILFISLFFLLFILSVTNEFSLGRYYNLNHPYLIAIIRVFNFFLLVMCGVLFFYRKKVFVQNISLLLISSALSFIVAEATYYSLTLYIPTFDKSVYFKYIFDKDIGLWMKPNYHTNSFGMYDKERQLKKEEGVYRIAALGDSFTNGVYPGIGYRTSDLLEKMTPKNVEVLNFGMSSLGTVQEIYVYRHKISQFKPDLVILGIYTGNDIRNNYKPLELASGYMFLENMAYAELDESQALQLYPPNLNQIKDLTDRKTNVLTNLISTRLIQRFVMGLINKPKPSQSTEKQIQAGKLLGLSLKNLY